MAAADDILYGHLGRAPASTESPSLFYDDAQLIEQILAELEAAPPAEVNRLHRRKARAWLQSLQAPLEKGRTSEEQDRLCDRWLQTLVFPLMSPRHQQSHLAFPERRPLRSQRCRKCDNPGIDQTISIKNPYSHLCLPCVIGVDNSEIVLDPNRVREWLSERYQIQADMSERS